MTEELEVALDGTGAGLQQEPAGDVVDAEMAVLLEQRDQLGEERLKAL